MNTFRWTIPEPRRSTVEVIDHANYPRKRQQNLSNADQKFLQKWGEERALGRKAFRRKMILRSCLVLSLITGSFLILKLFNIIDSETSIYTTAFLITFISNAVGSMPTWKKNEKRYSKLIGESAE